MDKQELIDLVIKQIPKPLWNRWELCEKIGEGAFSSVYRIKAEKLTHDIEEAALKIVLNTADGKSIVDPKRKTQYLTCQGLIGQEAKILSELKDCKYVVQQKDGLVLSGTIDVLDDKNNKTQVSYYLMGMELLQNVADMIESQTMPMVSVEQDDSFEQTVLMLANNIGQAVRAAHEKNIMHRDIKPENMYYSKKAKIFKIGDFNISKKSEISHSFAGDKRYMAPEVLNIQNNASGGYQKNADIYSLGLCLYQMMNNNKLPFEDEMSSEEANTARSKTKKAFKLPSNGSSQFKEFIVKACHPNPQLRFESAEAFLEALNDLDHDSPPREQVSNNSTIIKTAAVLLAVAVICIGIVIVTLMQRKSDVKSSDAHMQNETRSETETEPTLMTETATETTTTTFTESVLPTKLELTSSIITLTVGESLQYSSVEVYPEAASDRGLLWSSSDPQIATVDPFGKITAVASGSCVVNVSAHGNPNITERITIYVEAKETERSEQLSAPRTYIGSGFVTTVKSNLTHRKTPTNDGERIHLIPQGTRLELYSCDTEGWYYTSYQNKGGYVSGIYIILETPTLYGTGTVTGWMKTTTGQKVRLRTGPSENCDTILMIPYGDCADIGEIAHEWRAVTYEGKCGFVKDRFVSLEPVNPM